MMNLFKEGLYIKAKDGTEIIIPINAKVSIIRGDSATGKTKMIRYLSDIIMAKEVEQCNYELSNIKVIRDMLEYKLFVEGKAVTNNVIFIDKFDMTNFEESIPFIESSENYFILCAHRNVPKCGWCKESILELEHSKKRYILKQKEYGW